ncbi:hypothetical protein AB0K09_09260 [Streptomyces sp. NPDC049577]|uniref:hypothetical protein n=1 Tax=Streptomyces sp. NPDC049577 TaxID=3155153 RepID=UPI00343CA06C
MRLPWHGGLFRRRPRSSYPYGLLVPVARVATPTAAEEIRRFLDTCGIRSTTAPCPGRPRRGPGGLRWRLQVLVFADDAGRARRLVNDWTLPLPPAGRP